MDQKLLQELIENIKQQNSYFRYHQVVLRGFVTGIFTALGATIGFTLLIVMFGWIIGLTGDIPLLQKILEETKLDIIIENQLNQIENGDSDNLQPTPTLEPTPDQINQQDNNVDQNSGTGETTI